MRRFYLLIVLVSVALFSVSCDKDDSAPETQKNYYFLEVSNAKTYTKSNIIAIIKAIAPQVNINAMSMLIRDIRVVAITYNTKDVDGNDVVASGVIAIPSKITSYETITSIQHGTVDRPDAPSLTLLSYEMLPAIFGRVVVIADYLGYGANQRADGSNPYMHQATMGTACADMIEAAREYLRSKDIQERTNNVVLAGYSQGGTASMATLLEMNKRGQLPRIKEVHVGAGVYDLLTTFKTVVANTTTPFRYSGFIPYLIRGLECGDRIELDPTKIYAPRIISEGIIYKFATKELSDLNSLLGTDITKVVHPDFYAGDTFNNNAEIVKLMDALANNSVINSEIPSVPITIYHSPTDDFVPFFNSELLQAKCPRSTLIQLQGVHSDGVPEFILRVMGFWDLIN